MGSARRGTPSGGGPLLRGIPLRRGYPLLGVPLLADPDFWKIPDFPDFAKKMVKITPILPFF
jgi:hypothetical protein